MLIEARIEQMPDRFVASVRHVGPHAGIGVALARVFAWADSKDLLRFPETEFLAVYYDDPQEVESSKLRSDACLTVPENVEGEDDVVMRTIPGGLFAVGRAEINKNEFHPAWQELTREWMPENGVEPDKDRFRLELYLNDPEEHPEGKFIVALCEPVRRL